MRATVHFVRMMCRASLPLPPWSVPTCNDRILDVAHDLIDTHGMAQARDLHSSTVDSDNG